MIEKTPSALTGIAGVHFVVSDFSRRGMIALPTVRNTSAYDVIVVSQNGRRQANIQVKTSSKRVTFWPMPPSTKIRSGPNDYYVLLRWLDKEDRYEAFMLTGREAKLEVERGKWGQEQKIKKGSRKGYWPAVHVAGKHEVKSRRWAARWAKFLL